MTDTEAGKRLLAGMPWHTDREREAWARLIGDIEDEAVMDDRHEEGRCMCGARAHKGECHFGWHKEGCPDRSRFETPGLDALREADFRRNVGLLLRDVTDYIEAMTALCAALRAGGRTPEAQLKTLDRLSDVPMRALALRAALAPDTEETL